MSTIVILFALYAHNQAHQNCQTMINTNTRLYYRSRVNDNCRPDPRASQTRQPPWALHFQEINSAMKFVCLGPRPSLAALDPTHSRTGTRQMIHYINDWVLLISIGLCMLIFSLCFHEKVYSNTTFLNFHQFAVLKSDMKIICWLGLARSCLWSDACFEPISCKWH